MQDKYIDLIINRCMDLDRSKVVFISYNKEIEEFIDKFVLELNNRGVTDIYRDCEDVYYTHDLLKDIDIDDVNTNPYFDCSIWDEYVKKDANFVMFVTEVPGLYDDILADKLAIVGKRKNETRPLYRKLQSECKLLWSIVPYPGERWGKFIYNSSDGYNKLENSIYKMCMVCDDNPVLAWDKFIDREKKIIDKLNSLNLERLHYSNSLGTNLDIYLPDEYQYSSAIDGNIMVNMPSYEVFTSPYYNKTEGIVYSSKPLIYNGGYINDFYLEFKEGKIVKYDAREGLDILRGIIESDEYSCYLGEAALVPYDSPISNLNTNFNTTLIDENASCHLAIGSGFPECIKGGINLDMDILRDKGINNSIVHVDFMIGTSDLDIIGYTKDGKEIKIFENGNYSKDIICE